MEHTLEHPTGTDAATARTAGWPLEPRGWWPGLLGDTAYSLLALPVGIAGFVLAVTGISAGVPLVIVWVGLPVLAGTLLLGRALAHAERLRIRSQLGEPAPAPAYRSAGPGAGAFGRVLTPLRDPRAWLELGWGVVAFVTGIVSFVLTVTWWAAAAGGLTYWFWQRFIPVSEDENGLAELLGLGDGRVAESWLNLAIGLIAFLTLPLVARLAAQLHAAPARSMLCGRADG